MMITFEEWAERVVEALRSNSNETLKVAIADAEAREGDPPDELLLWLRGDEPFEAYERGDSADEYALFLGVEWETRGPQSE